MPESDDKRVHPRMKARWPVTILTDQGPVQGETANVSATGAFVKCKGKFRKGEVYWMLIGFDSRAAMINARALWLDRGQAGETGEARGVGLRFEI